MGVRVIEKYVGNPRFADDFALLSNSEEALQSIHTTLDQHSRTVDYKIIMHKTKVTINELGTAQRLEIGGGPLKW